jgi:hypothetical protein
MGQKQQEAALAVLAGHVGASFAAEDALGGPGANRLFETGLLRRPFGFKGQLGKNDRQRRIVSVGAKHLFVKSFEEEALAEPTGPAIDR